MATDSSAFYHALHASPVPAAPNLTGQHFAAHLVFFFDLGLG